MLRTVLLSSLLLPLLLPFGTLAFHELFKRDAKGHNWNYEDATGPDHWPKMFKKCGGSEQSPIDIITADADHNDRLDEFDFSDNYDDNLEGAIIENNGHTIQIRPGPKDSPRVIAKGGRDDKYQFEQLHFHWGSDSKKGSEHKINGQSFPLEMHLVHRNADYKSVEAAVHKEDGLAVLSVLFKLDDKDNPDLKPIIDKLDDVRKEGTSAEMDDFSLQSLLPDDLMPYYRYQGSLTTPPCYEVVTWTVFKDFASISQSQLEQFRNVKEEDEHEPEESLVNNFRPVQQLHDRVVQVSGEEDDDDDDDDNAGVMSSPTAILVLSILAFFL
nr:venom protein [Lampona murina]